MSCDLCGIYKVHTTNAVVQGKYGAYCSHCIKGFKRMDNAGHAHYMRDRDREAHEVDMLQPWVNGKPNRDFIHQYPEESLDMFSKDELNY
jgi:hypothetical protein